MANVAQYDKDNLYLGPTDDYNGPMPFGCAADFPPTDGLAEHQKWRRIAPGQFVAIDDHRGKEGWLNGERATIRELGPLPAGWSDAEPPKQLTLDEAKAEKIVAVDDRTQDLIAAGFEFAGKRFSMSEAAQRNWIALSSGLANAMIVFPITVSTVGEESHVLATENDLRGFLAAYLAYQADPTQPLGAGRVLKESIAAAATIEELEAITDDRES